MRFFKLISLLFFPSSILLAQSNCHCKKNPQLSTIIKCDTIVFKNNAKLLRQFNCDSSWLVFQKPNNEKRIMYSLKGSEMELAERLGYQFVKEYNSSLLFENRQASGGGFPINYALVDKDSGKPYQIGPIIYYSDSTTNNFILYLSDSRDALVFHNIDLDKKFFFTIPDKRIMNSGLMFPERLFDIPKKHRQILTITYKYRDKASPSEKWNKDKIIIDLAKYSR